MSPAASLLSTLVLALVVVGNPIVVRDNLIRLPFAKRVNATSAAQILQVDQARAAAFRLHGQAKATGTLSHDAIVNVGVQDQAVTYVASVGVGNPPTTYSLLIDTGSSNTWVGAGKRYVQTKTSKQTPNRVSVTYGSGSFSGTEFTDTVTIASGLVIPAQSIGVASNSAGFNGVDGILGIGPVYLTKGTLSPASTSTVPTVTDNLFSNGAITANQIGVSFQPTTAAIQNNGELTFGGIDNSKFTGTMTFAPITSTFPASAYWGINQSVRYGSSTNILSSTAGIVDTGTTLLLIATDALARYKTATGAVPDTKTGLLTVTPAQFANLQSLFFTIAGTTFEFTANAQAWPRTLNTLIGGKIGSVYLIIGDLGSKSGSGLDFINGFAFLERFYTVYDTANRRIGFAATQFTTATTN